MSDWAEIAADECLHNCDEGTPLRGLIEKALRKGIIYLTPRDIRGRYLLMERIRRTLTRR